MRNYNNYFIVGCGGVANYFLPPFIKMFWRNKKNKINLIFWDKDQYELKNLDRQLDDSSQVGMAKAVVMERNANKVFDQYKMSKTKVNVKTSARTLFFTPDDEIPDNSFVFCFVDNHEARLSVLNAIKKSSDSACIFAANGEQSAHAYYYSNDVAAHENGDPLDRYPEIATDKSDSPLRLEGCDSEVVLNSSPQTPLANSLAATLALNLWNVWVNDPAGLVSATPEEAEMLKPRLIVEFSVGPNNQDIKRLGNLK